MLKAEYQHRGKVPQDVIEAVQRPGQTSGGVLSAGEQDQGAAHAASPK